MYIKLPLLAVSVLLVLFAGCTSFYPYKMDIRQGNYVTAEMRSKVKVGMSRQQVSSILGSPLISDIFHANRWDYLYRLEEKGKLVEQQRYTLFFNGEFVSRIDDSQADSRKAAGTAPSLPAK